MRKKGHLSGLMSEHEEASRAKEQAQVATAVDLVLVEVAYGAQQCSFLSLPRPLTIVQSRKYYQKFPLLNEGAMGRVYIEKKVLEITCLVLE